MKYVMYLLLAFVILGGVIYLQANIWNECRQTNSFLYCLRVLSK